MIYLVIGIGVLLFSIIVNVITYLIFKTAIAIAVASLFEVFIWYLTTNYVLSRLYQIKWKKNTFYLILMILVFESITGMNSLWVSMVVYVLAYILITLSFFKSNLIKMIRLFKN